MRRVLVTGRNGQLGWELQHVLRSVGEIFPVDRRDMDLADPDSIRACIRRVRPNLIVNAAAYTAVDRAEREPELAMAINGVAPGVIGEEAKRLGAAVVHYSTDYVFDGEAERPYTESDIAKPLNTYGRTKLHGETALRQVGVAYLILRTSWLYSIRGRNFLLRVLQMVSAGDTVKVVNDQLGSPTWCRLVADATAQIIKGAMSGTGEGLERLSGSYHMSCEGYVTWFGFANAIVLQFADQIANRPQRLHQVIEPIVSAQYQAKAMRPRFSALSNQKLFDMTGVRLPTWQRALEMCHCAFAASNTGADFSASNA